MILHKLCTTFSSRRLVAPFTLLLATAAAASLATVGGAQQTATAQESSRDAPEWSGVWQADTEDMVFTLRVTRDGDQFTVDEVAPTGMGWRVRNGAISGQSGTIDVSYQGVQARVLVQLTQPDVAMVRSMSCQPDYHVVCTLVRNQQARFVRLQED